MRRRNIRIKTAIINILKEFPEGLDSRQIGEKLSSCGTHGVAKARPTGVQLGQLLACTRGVENMGTTQVSVGGDYMVDYTLWVLTDIDKWNAWANRSDD